MLRDRIRPLIPQIVSRELTNRDVARQLGASEFWVCRVLKQLQVERDPIEDLTEEKKKRRELAETRMQHRLRVAHTLPIAEAAKAAGCSTRTIYRLRSRPYDPQRPQPGAGQGE